MCSPAGRVTPASTAAMLASGFGTAKPNSEFINGIYGNRDVEEFFDEEDAEDEEPPVNEE